MPSAHRRGMGTSRVESDRSTGAVQHSQDEAAPEVVQFQGQFLGFDDNMATLASGVVVGTLTHDRTDSNNSGVEEYLRKNETKQYTFDNIRKVNSACVRTCCSRYR